ncbi:hypothetical protein TrRE_jg3792, partial [Triparma retinervis]
QQERRVSSSPTPAAEGGRRGRSWSPGQGGEGRRLQRDRTPSPAGGREEEERRGSMGGNEVEEEWRDLIEDAREGYTGWVEEPSANPRDLEDMRIRVSVRKRPLSLKERSKGEVDVLQVAAGKGRVIVHQPKTRVDLEKVVESGVFEFDNGFGEDCGNRRVYKEAVKNLVGRVWGGCRGSVFAYGQTGSGKTFTMMGEGEEEGVTILAAEELLDERRRRGREDLDIHVSLFEIYGGKLFDLLSERKVVKCLEDGKGRVCFLGLTEHKVSDLSDVRRLISEGGEGRSTGSTSKNDESSRSHAVLQFSIRKQKKRRERAGEEFGRLSFIDLAGSERGKDTDKSDKQTRLEGAEINTSLLALKEVIRSLAVGSGTQHIPFRGSKLTQVLKDSFVGEDNCSVMIACVGPGGGDVEHTLNTLRYADRVKERGVDTDGAEGTNHPNQQQEQQQQIRGVNTKNLDGRPGTAPSSRGGGGGTANQGRRSLDAGVGGLGRRSIDGGGRLSEALERRDREEMKGKRRESLAGGGGQAAKENNSRVAGGGADRVANKVRERMRRRSMGMAGGRERAEKEAMKLVNDKTKPNIRGGGGKEGRQLMKQKGRELIECHRSGMTKLLAMVKVEMKMVNQADQNRDFLEEYLNCLEELVERKREVV